MEGYIPKNQIVNEPIHILSCLSDDGLSTISRNIIIVEDNAKANIVQELYSPKNEKQQKMDEYDQFLVKPFEVEEGVLECNKCGSKKTFSYSKQTRAGDEATTVFATCFPRTSYIATNLSELLSDVTLRMLPVTGLG